jgi:hypothetical protein
MLELHNRNQVEREMRPQRIALRGKEEKKFSACTSVAQQVPGNRRAWVVGLYFNVKCGRGDKV